MPIIIDYDHQILDIIEIINEELEKFGVVLVEDNEMNNQLEKEGRPSAAWKVEPLFSLPEVHHPDCNCSQCK